MRLRRLSIICVAAAAWGACVAARGAQTPMAKATLDSTYVIVGRPMMLHLEAIVPEGTPLLFPPIAEGGVIVAQDDTLDIRLEVADVTAVDTTSAAGGLVTMRQDIKLLAFDSASLYVPPFQFVAGGDTIFTNALALKVVVPFEVEVDPQKYFDIKPPQAPDWVWTDYAWWIVGPLLCVLLCAALYFGYRYYKRHRAAEDGLPPTAEPPLPPYDRAMAALEALEARKLWQQGLFKQYHTELADILRDYIVGRFGTPAREQTSYEILADMQRMDDVTPSSRRSLKQVLELSDLVKFAKYEPLADDNHLSAVNAKMFVSQTVEEKCVDSISATASDEGADEGAAPETTKGGTAV